ncbi:hypothetical protein PENSPDRAFT_253079 [Peniophora sp. CONT]|nr:hypothetical protein PENSPDRAFT_253079 [Peniophora sp. CONT]
MSSALASDCQGTSTMFADQVEELVSRRIQELDSYLLRMSRSADLHAVSETLVDESLEMNGVTIELARRLNLLRAPILRLPPELLQAILVLASADSAAVSTTRPVPWIHLGHICSKIRHALLSTHEVWANIVFTPCHRPDITEELLRRAAGVPLAVRIIEASPEHLSKLAALHLHNAHSIVISVPSALDALLLSFAGTLASHLVNLDLDYDGNPPAQNRDRIMISLSRPLRAPLLASLRLHDVLITFVAAHLTELILTLGYLRDRDGQAGPTLLQMYDSLSLCTKLRVLHVHGTSKYLSASSREITKSIPLPSLKELDLEDTNDCILWLWSRLSIPSDATVNIRQVEKDAWPSPPHQARPQCSH